MNALSFLSSHAGTSSASKLFQATMLPLMLLLMSLTTATNLHSQSITCQGNVEVGFGPWCKVDLAASQYVNNPSGTYTFEIVGTDISGTLPFQIDADQIDFNTSYGYKITNSGGVTCDHGTLTFRDYTPPFCGTFDPIVTAYCTADDLADAFTGPDFSDCSSFTVNYTDDIEDDCNFAPYEGKKVVRKITRTWTAIDIHGNQSVAACSQQLYVLSPDIDNVDALATVEIACDKNVAVADAIDPANLPIEALPHFDIDGELVQISSLCKYAIVKFDSDPVPHTGGKVKVFRTWSITNWCTSETKTIQQTLVFVDTEAPVITVVDEFVLESNVFSDSPFKLCEAIGQLPTATATDNCSEDADITISIFIPLYSITIPNGSVLPLGLPFGDNEVIYTAKDECGTEMSKIVTIKVVDTTKPVAICTPYKNVGITNGATTSVAATEFENGSTDNCCIDRFEVRRTDAANGDMAFDTHVDFSCEDDMVGVIFRVYDCAGNFNDCTLEVTVQDLIDPTITAPVAMIDTCTNVVGLDLSDIVVLQDRYGVPTILDNCEGAVFIENAPVITPLDCEGQNILRSFYGIDAFGNLTIDTVYQLVQVKGLSKFEVTFPADIEIDCAQEIPLVDPITTNLGCGDLFSRYEDIIYNQDEGACYKIIRTWEIIDWCAFDVLQSSQGSEVVLSPTVEGDPHVVMDGYIKFIQEIKVTDNEAPVITAVPDDIVVDILDDCQGAVTIPAATFSDNNCNGAAQVIAKINGLQVTIGSTVTGTHGDELTIIYQAVDGCQNYSEEVETTISFVDSKKPTPVCLSLSTELGSGGEVLIWANDFDSGSSYDNCELTTIHRINKIIDVDGDGNFLEDVIQTPPTADKTSITFTCGDQGNQYVQYWIRDIAGNWEYCVTAIFITDADDDDCATANAEVAGYIQTADGENIEQVEVQIDDPTMPTIFTAFDGFFNFVGLGSNQAYTITPKKDIADDNGISTFDMVMMQRHILGVSKLESPYLMMAADVNESGSISTGDMLELRRLILGINDGLTKTDSWKFIPADYTFSDPSDPFSSDVPESITAMSGSEVEFIGYKMGDLNLNANTANLLGDDLEGAIDLVLDNEQFETGDRVEVAIRTIEALQLLGLGLDISFDDFTLAFEGIESTILPDFSPSMYHVEDSKVKLLWSDAYATSVDTDKTFVTLIFTANATSDVAESLQINGSNSSTAVVEEGSELLEKEVLINVLNISSDIKLYQNQPNPFADGTMIRFDLPGAEHVALEVMDISGKMVYELNGTFPRGENQVMINAQDLPDSGVYYYRLSSGNFIETKKLIYIKN